MKFSPRKKAKIRRCNQRRINRIHRRMVGYIIDYENHYEVVDQAQIHGVMYLLVKVEDRQYAIYKIVKPCVYIKLSAKKVLLNKKAFSKYTNWKERSVLEISESGEIVSLKQMRREVVRKNGKPVYVHVIVDI